MTEVAALLRAGTDALAMARKAERAGHLADARDWYRCALQDGSEPRTASRAAILRWIGGTHRAGGEREAALRAFRASLASARADGHVGDVAHALNWIGIVSQDAGRLKRADRLFELARVLAEQVSDHHLVAMVDHNVGINANIRGELHTALDRYTRALAVYRELSEVRHVAELLNVLGMLYVDLKLWGAAAEVLVESEVLCQESGDGRTLLMVLVNQAELALERNRLETARSALDRAMETAHELNLQDARGEIHKLMGVLHLRLGDPAVAEWHLVRAVQLAERYSNPLLVGEARRELAHVYREQHRNQDALQALIEARRVFKELSARRDLAKVDERVADLEALFLRIVEEWGESIESKDRYTAGHCRRVARYTTALGEAVGVEADVLPWLRMGALLHDVGKIAVPGSILNKAGPLTSEERRMMQEHTVVGAEIVSDLDFPWDITAMVRGHHEAWDGGGYPDGLRGAEIPLPARILCIADVYDALTTTRSYRRSYSPGAALQIMAGEAGTLLDPQLFEAFRDLVAPRLAQVA